MTGNRLPAKVSRLQGVILVFVHARACWLQPWSLTLRTYSCSMLLASRVRDFRGLFTGILLFKAWNSEHLLGACYSPRSHPGGMELELEFSQDPHIKICMSVKAWDTLICIIPEDFWLCLHRLHLLFLALRTKSWDRNARVEAIRLYFMVSPVLSHSRDQECALKAISH